MDINKLPQDFKDNMMALLGADYDNYIEHMATSEPRKGLRVNTLKISSEEASRIFPFDMMRSDFCPLGYYLTGEGGVGTHPYHHAGLFYMQEPSAMSVVTAIAPYIGERVLDLCSAPGGKGTYLASLMDGKGTLVLNEYVHNRATILRSNVERMGIRNATITNNSPDDFAKLMPSYFDTIVVDAPCSGEGMFLKEPNATLNWNMKNVEICAVRQLEILSSAYEALSGDGYLIYSTCTLNTIENEGVVEKFLRKYSDMEVVEVDSTIRSVTSDGYGITAARRIFPHRSIGEGHFFCLFHKTSGERNNIEFDNTYTKVKNNNEFIDIYNCLSNTEPFGNLYEYNDKGYLLPDIVPYKKGINLIRSGVLAYSREKKRLVPEHNLVMALRKGEVENEVRVTADSREVMDFLKGNTLNVDTTFRGFGVLTVDGYPLSLIKAIDGTIKNHYPKGLRNLK